MISTGALHIDVMSEEGISYYVEGAIEISTWLLHFIYVMTLVERLTPSIRGEFYVPNFYIFFILELSRNKFL